MIVLCDDKLYVVDETAFNTMFDECSKENLNTYQKRMEKLRKWVMTHQELKVTHFDLDGVS